MEEEIKTYQNYKKDFMIESESQRRKKFDTGLHLF